MKGRHRLWTEVRNNCFRVPQIHSTKPAYTCLAVPPQRTIWIRPVTWHIFTWQTHLSEIWVEKLGCHNALKLQLTQTHGTIAQKIWPRYEFLAAKKRTEDKSASKKWACLRCSQCPNPKAKAWATKNPQRCGQWAASNHETCTHVQRKKPTSRCTISSCKWMLNPKQ